MVWGLLLFFALDTSAQSLLNRLEFGVSGQALSDYVDLNSDEKTLRSTSQLQFIPAAIIRYNMPYRFAVRGGYFEKETIESLSAFEIGASGEWISLRTFESAKDVDLKEDFISVMGEFHFNDFNFYQNKSSVVPYLGIGLAYILRNTPDLSNSLINSLAYEVIAQESNKEVFMEDLEKAFIEALNKNRKSVMVAFGGKIKLNRLIISGEFSGGLLIPIGTDEIPKDGETLKVKQKNKSSLNDWYVFPNFTITYTFGPNF
jgi:hypothetical protein